MNIKGRFKDQSSLVDKGLKVRHFINYKTDGIACRPVSPTTYKVEKTGWKDRVTCKRCRQTRAWKAAFSVKETGR